jgi:hypothetical protein
MQPLPPRPIASSLYALTQMRDARPADPLGCKKMQAETQIIRWSGNDVGVVIDITIDFDLVGFCPTRFGRWQCEPADREPFARSQYTFQFTGAAPDDPDEPALTGPEMIQLAAWFDAHHDTATEHAADRLRDLEV